MAILDEIADEVFPAEKKQAAVEKPAPPSKTASVLDSVADEVFEGKAPPEKPPGMLSRAADAVTSAVTAIPKAIATGFKTVGPTVAPGAAAPPKDVALPQGPTPEALKATGRSASVIPEPVAPTPPVPIKLGPVPGLEAVSAEAQKAPLLERVSGASPGSPLPVPERPAPGGMLGRAAAKAGVVDPAAAKRRAAEAEFAETSVMAKPEGVDPGWWQVQQDIRQANRVLDAMPKEFVNRILLGIPNAIKDTFGFDSPQARAPQSTAEAITGGTGDLAGFIVGPAKVAHAMLATNITKALAPQAGNAIGTIMAKSIANEAATLAVASGLAHAGDVTQADSMKEAFHQLGEHVKGGAILGATFGGLGNVIPANTLMQRSARLGVGLGVLDVVQGTSITDDRALGQKVYDYGLNIYFLWKGKDPRAIKASLEAAAAARSKPGAEVTPEQVLKSVLDKAMERADNLKPAEPELPGAPAPDRSAELSAILAEELAAATAPLKSAAEVATEKTGGPLERPVPEAAAPEIVLAGGPRPAARPAAPPRPTQNVGIPGQVPTIGAGPVRILGPSGRPVDAVPAPVEGLKSAQELAAERAKGISRPARPAPQAPPAAVPEVPAGAAASADRPVPSLSFKDYVELSGKKWPLTSREPDYARLRFEFDDMKKGLYEARPVGDGRWAVINRKTGEEVDHLPSGAKAQLESNRLNGVVTLDAWRNAQIPQATVRMVLPERKADLSAKPAPEPKVEAGTAAAQQKEAEAATLAGPKASAEPPAEAKAPTPPASSVLVGKSQEIRVPAGSKYQIRYEVVEADSMIPSHDSRTFAKDPRYPEGVQNRPYHSDKSEQAKVIRQGQDFEPLFLVSPQPSSGGTPIVAPDSNVVLSGNSRTMSLLRTRGTEAYDRYRAALAEMAPALGLKAEDLAKVQNPVLVRRLVGTDTSAEFYRRFARETNENFKQALNTQAAAVSQGNAMKPETLEWIAGAVDTLGEAATLRDFLRSGRDREIIRRFIQDGVFTERDLNRYIDPKTTQLNEDGKRLVERVILGNAIPDPDLLAQAPASIVAKIERSLGALAKIKGRGEAWELGKDLEEAVRTVVQVQASGAGNVDALRRQGSLLEEAGPTSRADTLADALLRMKPNDFKAAIGRYADDAQRDVRGQETLGFAKPEDPASAFRNAFGESAAELRVAEEPRGYSGSPAGERPASASRSGEAGTPSIQSLATGPAIQAEPSQRRSEAPPSDSTNRTRVPSDSTTAESSLGSAIASTSTPTVLQPTKSIKALRGLAVEHEQEVTTTIREAIADIPGVSFLGSRVKKLEESQKKVVRKGQDADHLHDYLGARVVADNRDALEQAADAIEQRFRTVERDSKLEQPTMWGYRALHLDLKMPDGFIFEVQVLPRPVSDYQNGEGHRIYEKWRSVGDRAGLTNEQIRDFLADRETSRNGYERAYEGWLRGARQESTEPPENYDLPSVGLAEAVDAGGGRGAARAAGGLMMRMLGGVRETRTPYRPDWNVSDDIPDFPGRGEPGQRISRPQMADIRQLEPTERKTDENTVNAIARAIRNGEPLPAIVVNFSAKSTASRDVLDVVDGHARLKAAQQLGLTEVPVRIAVDSDFTGSLRLVRGVAEPKASYGEPLTEGQPLFSPESPYAASKARARKGATTFDRESAQMALFDLDRAVSTPVESVRGPAKEEFAKQLKPGETVLLQTPAGEPIARLKMLTNTGRAAGTYEVLDWIGGEQPTPFQQQGAETYRKYFEGRTDRKLFFSKEPGTVSREGAKIGYIQLAAADAKYLGQDRAKRPPLRGEDAGAGVRTVSRMVDEFKDKGFIDFRGQTVREGPEGLRDLAVIGQIARDPRYETFRYFYTKGDMIVGSEAFSSRLPGATNIYEGVQRRPAGGFGMAEVDREIARRQTDQAKSFAGMRRRMERLGADGYYVMHNHPSGRAEPSSADLGTTEYLASKVPGFKGHVVIDSGEFAEIRLSDAGHAVATVARLDPAGEILRISQGNAPKAEDPLLRRVGAQEIKSAEDLAQIGRNLKTPENYVSLVHRDGSGAVRAVQEMPVNLFMRGAETQDFIRGQQRAFGASSTFAVFKPTGMTLDQARQYIRQGVLADAIAPGATAAESALNVLQGRGEMPISGTPREPEQDLRTVRVQEPETPYGDFERLKPETRKKLVDFGREVLQDNKTDFASWSKAMREKLGEKSAGTLPGAWSALMQEQARTQAKPTARPTERKGGKPPEPPKDIPRSAGPIDPPPGLTEPQLKLGLHKDVVDAAMELFKAGKIERDPKMLISDQILDAIRDGKLRIEDMAQVLDSRGMTFSDFGTQMFRPAITDAARRLGALGQLQRRLNELESELTGAAPGRPGGKPGEPDPDKLKTIGDILDAARAIDPAREAKIRNRTLAAALAYWRRADNVRRGLLVTQLATSVRNFTSQVGRLGLDVMDQGIEGGLQRAFGKEVTAHPADSMKAMMDVFRVSPAEAKRRVDALLEGLPREEERLFSNYASDLNRVAKKQGAHKAIDAGLRGAEKAVEVLNTFNRFQEYAVRRAVFQAELGARLRRRGIDLEAAIKDPTVRREIPVADIRAAIERSLEITFASNPAFGSAGYHFIKWINKTPGATFLIPFPRFMVNAMKFYLEFSPAGFLKFLSEAERQKFRQGDMKTMSRGLLGIGLLSSAYLIRSMQDDDTKWNEVRLPGMERTIDVRPLNPFASYLFVADVLRRVANGNLYGGGLATEAVKNILGVNVRGGTGLQAMDQLVDGLRDIGDARALTKYLQGAGGHLVAGLLTPLQQLTDVYAEFDPEAQIMRNVKESPFSGPIKQRFPSTMVEALGGDIGDEKASPTSIDPLKREAPGLRQITGLTLGKAKNDFEKELDRLQIPYREILPSQRDPRLDNMLAAEMGPIAEESGSRIVNSARYQNLGEIGKRLELKAYLQRLRKKAKAQAMTDKEYRDVAREVKAGVSKERLKEMAQEEKAGLR